MSCLGMIQCGTLGTEGGDNLFSFVFFFFASDPKVGEKARRGFRTLASLHTQPPHIHKTLHTHRLPSALEGP